VLYSEDVENLIHYYKKQSQHFFFTTSWH